ncbi:hypothetical protein [Celeribacter indicus]|uniref:Uncharacterized protein n=1 Tax=Celeribacter indicus TaxID=1208324 RepID=A0A0B5E7L7_9RHOB|nr:hypothetical protein [Celeribacter indicus]AJE49056.1 hypothetical protein P73_4341 [Celeribacter indicus]SDW44819.1 hypothetical protein SAMN05443573_103265 [Celeribacter indicus]
MTEDQQQQQHQHPPQPDEDRQEFAAEAGSLWRLTLPPATWAVHFVLCYSAVSLACVRGLLPIGLVRIGLLGASVIALCLIALEGRRALRQWDVRNSGVFVHKEGTDEDRHRFLGHATFLLAIISGIGTTYTSLPLLMLGGCR